MCEGARSRGCWSTVLVPNKRRQLLTAADRKRYLIKPCVHLHGPICPGDVYRHREAMLLSLEDKRTLESAAKLQEDGLIDSGKRNTRI